MLELADVAKRVGEDVHLHAVSMKLEPGSFNVLLGPTRAGKTTLLRLMAGLDSPTSGRILADGEDMTGVGVRKRDVAMVYQQFINYPSLTVRENIASPLRLRGLDRSAIADEVDRAAALLGLEPYLDRKPLELSGGQQQRVALARAIVKRARLVLLDEPLANLDYKLREELRERLPGLFAETGAVVVYATSEPSEALMLGGYTATLHEGQVTQFGPTPDVYRRPNRLATARSFSDPPLNVLHLDQTPALRQKFRDSAATVGFRAHHMRPGDGAPSDLSFDMEVTSTEITGSESYVHVAYGPANWCMLVHGVHAVEPGSQLRAHVRPADILAFDAEGRALELAGRG